MPRIFQQPYSKDLYKMDAPARYRTISRSFFLINAKGNYFKLTEYDVTGAAYEHLLLIAKLDMPEWIINYAIEDIDLALYPDIDTQVAHLVDTNGESFEEIQIGRFAYSSMEIMKDCQSVYGKQIFGAFIDNEYRTEGIGLQVYDFILDTYGCLISDNTQSVMGCNFWAQRLSMDYEVYTYDTNEKKVLERFSLESPCTLVPWSHQELDMATISKLHPIPTTDEDRTHIVLFTQSN